MTQTELKKLTKQLDTLFPDTKGASRAEGETKKTFKDYWPAIKSILLIAKTFLGFVPKIRLAVDSAIAAVESWLAGGTPDFLS